MPSSFQMRRTPGFKTRPSTYSIGLAPTNRATCKACKSLVGKEEVRIVTHAFVRPGRSHDFVCHARCATRALVGAMVVAHGSLERVSIDKCVSLSATTRLQIPVQYCSRNSYLYTAKKSSEPERLRYASSCSRTRMQWRVRERLALAFPVVVATGCECRLAHLHFLLLRSCAREPSAWPSPVAAPSG